MIMMASPNEQHQQLLAATIRGAAEWRRSQADDFDEEGDKFHQKQNMRSVFALKHFANFVESLPPEDRDLRRLRHLNLSFAGDSYHLCPEALRLLSRLWINQGASATSEATYPDERQLRNLLRRIAGAEQSARKTS